MPMVQSTKVSRVRRVKSSATTIGTFGPCRAHFMTSCVAMSYISKHSNIRQPNALQDMNWPGIPSNILWTESGPRMGTRMRWAIAQFSSPGYSAVNRPSWTQFLSSFRKPDRAFWKRDSLQASSTRSWELIYTVDVPNAVKRYIGPIRAVSFRCFRVKYMVLEITSSYLKEGSSKTE